MAIGVLIVIGVALWLMLRVGKSKPKQIHQPQSKADKEFEEMYLNGACDDIDDL